MSFSTSKCKYCGYEYDSTRPECPECRTVYFDYWVARAKAGKLPLEAASIITDWKHERERLMAVIHVLKEGVPHA